MTYPNGSCKTIDQVKKLTGACVNCQYRLPIPHDMCPDIVEREEGCTFRYKCFWCKERNDDRSHKITLARYCGATNDQMDLVIRVFNRACGKFQGKLTFASIVKDLNGMSFDNFNKKYNFHSWER